MAPASRMMILALVGVLTPLLASGQGSTELRGRVVSETGVAIAGVTITLTEIGYAIRTDSAGAFVLTGTPGSTLIFTVQRRGLQGRHRRGHTAAPRRIEPGVQARFRGNRSAGGQSVRAGPSRPRDGLRGRAAGLCHRSNQWRAPVIADDSGRFTIPPPAGRFWLLVRRIGFSPAELTLDARPDTAIRVRMTAVATALPEQRITGRAAFVSLDLSGFYRRMKDSERGINHGYFVTPEDFESRKPNLITQMAEGYPAVYMRRNVLNPRGDIIVGTPCSTPSKSCLPIGNNLFRCVMTVYLDRIRIVGKPGSMPDDFVNELIVPSQIAAMEIYPRGVGAPPEYQQLNGSCGVVLIWSK